MTANKLVENTGTGGEKMLRQLQFKLRELMNGLWWKNPTRDFLKRRTFPFFLNKQGKQKE